MGAPKRAAAGLLVGALSVAGLAFTAAPAGAVANVTEQRIEGADRFATAANVCDLVAPTGATNVLLATGRLSFADALTASSLAGDRNTCILLTEQDALPSATSAQLTQMKTLGTALTSVTILGGTVAVSQAVQDQVTALGGLTVNRIDGVDRFDTARDIATAIGTPGAIAGAGTVILANGENRLNGADAMAVGPVAARGDGTNPFPILLTNQNDIPTATLEALAATGVDNVIVLGGTDAISDAVRTQAGTAAGDTDVRRVQGATREDTAVQIAGLAREQGLAVTEVFLANGRIGLFSADALVSGPLGDVRGAATLLTSGVNTLGTAASTYLDANSNRITTVTAIGGADVISQAVLDAAEAAAETVANDSNQTVVVTPSEAAVNTVSASGTANTGARTYTVTVPTGATDVNIALFPAESVTVTGGTATFSGATPVAADTGVSIETVNGLSVEPASAGNGTTQVNDVAPAGGTVTFVIDSVVQDQVVPVVYSDTTDDAGNALSFTVAPSAAAPQAPAEAFGTGGRKSWIPTEVASGAIAGPQDITALDKTANYVVTAAGTYYYDDNDTFFVENAGNVCIQTTQALFEQNLSVGDDLSGTTYNGDPQFPSSLCLDDTDPAAPTGVTATAVDEDSISVAWTAVTGADAYKVYRTQVATAGTACPDTAIPGTYTFLADDTASPYVDNTLTASSTYCYAVTAVNDGDESALSDEAGDGGRATTSAAGTTAAPTATDTRLITDAGFVGEADAGDVWRIIFSEPVTVANGDVIRVQDAGGQFQNLTCAATLAGDATCVTNASAVLVDGTSYAAGRVLTITLGATTPTIDGDADGNAVNNDGDLDYPLTITTQSGITDATNNAWVPTATGSDNVIDNEGAQTVTQVPPTIVSAAGDESADTVVLTMSEAVTCNNDADTRNQFGFTDSDNLAAVNPTAIACAGTSITLTFADGAIEVADTADNIAYNDDDDATVEADDPQDLDANPLADDATTAVTTVA